MCIDSEHNYSHSLVCLQQCRQVRYSQVHTRPGPLGSFVLNVIVTSHDEVVTRAGAGVVVVVWVTTTVLVGGSVCC